MFNEAFPNVFDLESSFCIKYDTLKDFLFIWRTLGNAGLRNSGVGEGSCLLDMSMLVGLEKGDSEDKIEE